MSTSTITTSRPDTIVLIHGLWVTRRSWEHWIPYYEKQGYQVLAPSYPGLEVEVEALRRDPSPIEALTTEGITQHLETIIRALPRPPIIIGHSFGGALTQILLDRGLGVAGVAIDSVYVKGVRRLPLTTIKATWPVLGKPANWHKAVPFTVKQFRYAFTNTMSEEETRKVYDRYAIAAPGRVAFESATANFNPHSPSKVDFNRAARAPLLFIAGSDDNIMPAKLNKANADHYNTGIVGYREFAGRSHYICGEAGWQEVADYALAWAHNPVAGKLAA